MASTLLKLKRKAPCTLIVCWPAVPMRAVHGAELGPARINNAWVWALFP